MIPTTDEEHIGVEIECYGSMSRTRLRRMIYADRILSGKVHIGYDISVIPDRGDQMRYEIRILCTKRSRRKMVNRVMALLTNYGCCVNNTCSIHVHLDMRNVTQLRMRTVFFNLVRCSEFLFNLQRSHRRDSDYCTRNNYTTYCETIMKERGEDDRRRAINAQAYNKLSTLEIRLHHGTLDANEVNVFIDLLTKVKNKRKRITQQVETLQQLKTLVTRDNTLLQALEDRLEQYNDVA